MLRVGVTMTATTVEQLGNDRTGTLSRIEAATGRRVLGIAAAALANGQSAAASRQRPDASLDVHTVGGEFRIGIRAGQVRRSGH